MVVYKMYQGINLFFSVILFPVQIVLNLCLNLLAMLGIFFMPILLLLNFIYILLLGIVLLFSLIYKIPVVGPVVSIVGIFVAVFAQFIITITPALDGLRDRFKKLMIIDFYPYSLDMFLMTTQNGPITKEIKKIFNIMNNPALEPMVAEEIMKAEQRTSSKKD